MELKTIAWIAGGLAIAGLSGLLGVWIWRRKKTSAEKAEEELLKRTASPRPEPPPQPKPPHTPSSSPTSASATTRTAADQSPRTSASASGLGSFVSAATIASTLVGSRHREARKHETIVAEPAPEPAESFVDEQTSPAANEAPVLIKFNDRRKVHKIRRGAVVDVQTPDDAGVGDFRVSRDDVHVALIEQDPSRVRLRLDGGEGMVRLSLIDRSDRPVCAWKFKLVA
jgi:cytoskeletal protein RodZ